MNRKKKVLIISVVVILVMIIGIVIFMNIQKEQIDKVEVLENEINIDNISISIKENSLTKNSITLIFTSQDEFIYSTSSGEDYIIYHWENHKWNELEIQGKFNGTEMEIMRPATPKIEESINWNSKYGELKKGKYRLERDVSINNMGGKFYIEFEVK